MEFACGNDEHAVEVDRFSITNLNIAELSLIIGGILRVLDAAVGESQRGITYVGATVIEHLDPQIELDNGDVVNYVMDLKRSGEIPAVFRWEQDGQETK